MKRCLFWFFSPVVLAVLFVIFAEYLNAQQQQKLNPTQELQQAKIRIAELQVVLTDVKAERNAAIVEVSILRGQLADQRNGIMESEKLLQKAIDNDEKIDFYALSLLGWKLNLPDSTGSKSKSRLP
jgi:hypothetical protein